MILAVGRNHQKGFIGKLYSEHLVFSLETRVGPRGKAREVREERRLMSWPRFESLLCLPCNLEQITWSELVSWECCHHFICAYIALLLGMFFSLLYYNYVVFNPSFFFHGLSEAFVYHNFCLPSLYCFPLECPWSWFGLLYQYLNLNKFWRLEVWSQGASIVGFLMRALFLIYRQPSSCCVLMWCRETENKLSVSSYKCTKPHDLTQS